ncbi:SMI1/KNR4 family protein [Spirobacillus cienkowskii]|uniref:SMI1/KNR4 family protein n=1 Tax=Spirobacillus cienkowskii TaxID=495820 RepID=UPI0030D32E09
MKKNIVFRSYDGKIDVSMVHEFEKKTGFKFPKSYINIITKYNEARIANHMNVFYFYSNLIDRYESYSIGCFLGYNTDCSIESYWENILVDEEYDDDDGEDYVAQAPFPKNVIRFAVDPAGEGICFDYRHDPKTDNPKIVVWHHEAESGSSSELSFVATSFDEFLDMLYDRNSAAGKIYNEELFWKNRENRRKEALENQ